MLVCSGCETLGTSHGVMDRARSVGLGCGCQGRPGVLTPSWHWGPGLARLHCCERPLSGLGFPICEWGHGAVVAGAASVSVLSPAELMERAAVPPLWPALYPPGRSSLHHAQQLQLFSQQHFLRQQELLYLQQQAAQALELQRSAQLVVSGGGRSPGPRGSPPPTARQTGQLAETPNSCGL